PPLKPHFADAGPVLLARGCDCAAGFELERVLVVALRGPGPHCLPAAVLLLPDVAELMGDEIVGHLRGRTAEENRALQGVAVVAAKARQAEEPRRHADADRLELHRLRIEIEP